MVMLLITHDDLNKSLDQIIMFVPPVFDVPKVFEIARELGVSQPTIRLQTDMRTVLVGDLLSLIEPYAAYCL